MATDANRSDLLRSPLDARHRALGARMVPFAGFEMPLQYAGVLEEHRAVRARAGLFDVSHMGEFVVSGPDACRFADHVTPSRLSALDVGRAAYTALTTERGAFVDDILAYRLDEDRYLLVVNAANRAKDLAWLETQREGYDIDLVDESRETALVALQGPRSREILASVVAGFDPRAVRRFRFADGTIAGRPVRAARTGYTGEIGFEIFSAAADAEVVWDALLAAGAEHGAVPAGLAARDTLRLEAALPLYGQDIDETTSVLEADLEFIIDWTKDEFIGRDALLEERDRGVARRRIGFVVDGRGIARPGCAIYDGETQVATVTSGTFAPTLEKAIGMAYLPTSLAEPGRAITIDVRGRRVPAHVVALPFYRRPRSRPR
ncbi:MAG: glycine cleavage system aminomethyltransferase GcvT [Acidobacteria bacterium]|nr:MAG: glycine cleavage system aminomethyltransferase GcvT [Acidobacteriota bacterium]